MSLLWNVTKQIVLKELDEMWQNTHAALLRDGEIFAAQEVQTARNILALVLVHRETEDISQLN